MIGITRSFFVVCLLAFSMAVGAQSTEEIKQLAEQGDALGQAKLASLYLLGRNEIEVDNKMAAKWMAKAAKQGLVEAQVVLAAMYDRGIGMKGDRKKATEWYEKAERNRTSTGILPLDPEPSASTSSATSALKMGLI